MARKLTVKQEKFAMAYAETGNASEAYRQSYSAENMKRETIASKACLLLKRDNVQAMVKILQALARESHGVTVDTLTKEYEGIRKGAKKDKQYSAAVTAITGKARLHGLIDNNKSIGVNVNVAIVAPAHERPGEWERS